VANGFTSKSSTVDLDRVVAGLAVHLVAVVAGDPDQRVVALAARHPIARVVRVLVGDQTVVAGPAGQNVGGITGVDHVVAVAAVGVDRERVEAGGAAVLFERVVAAQAVDIEPFARADVEVERDEVEAVEGDTAGCGGGLDGEYVAGGRRAAHLDRVVAGVTLEVVGDLAALDDVVVAAALHRDARERGVGGSGHAAQVDGVGLRSALDLDRGDRVAGHRGAGVGSVDLHVAAVADDRDRITCVARHREHATYDVRRDRRARRGGQRERRRGRRDDPAGHPPSSPTYVWHVRTSSWISEGRTGARTAVFQPAGAT
jgi:hypothetical protein